MSMLAAPTLMVTKLKEPSTEQVISKISAGEGRIHGHIKLKGVNSNILM